LAEKRRSKPYRLNQNKLSSDLFEKKTKESLQFYQSYFSYYSIQLLFLYPYKEKQGGFPLPIKF